MTASQAQPASLKDVAGTIVLIGAGKMGSAMLDGWIGLGLDPSRVAVIEPQPTPEISALVARGLKLNPDPAAVPDPAVIVIAVKPQVAAEVVPAAAPFVGRSTVTVSIMAGQRLASPVEHPRSERLEEACAAVGAAHGELITRLGIEAEARKNPGADAASAAHSRFGFRGPARNPLTPGSRYLRPSGFGV